MIYFCKPALTCINLYCVALTYGRLRTGQMTHEKGLYVSATQYHVSAQVYRSKSCDEKNLYWK